MTMHIEAMPDPTDAAKQAREIGLGFGLCATRQPRSLRCSLSWSSAT